MNPDEERELDAVISEEKAKVVLGDGYFSLPYELWVEELKTFVTTQRCSDCGSPYDLDEPEEEMWGWFGGDDNPEVEEMEVVQFFCLVCVDMPDALRERDHPKTWGMLIFRREPTGTFPFDDNN